MTRRITVVVTCTNRKSVLNTADLNLRTIPPNPPGDRARDWIRRLRGANSTEVIARTLYTGNHWSVVRSLEHAAVENGLTISIWVASAGYGLVSIDSPLRPYSATFGQGTDSIGNGEAGRIWWGTLSKKRMAGVAFRSVEALAAAGPRSPLLIAASAPYISAMGDDVLAAGEILSPARLGIISAGIRDAAPFEPYLIPADARFKTLLGGPMQALNASVLKYAIVRCSEWYPNIAALRNRFGHELVKLKPFETTKRTPQSDAQICQFIRRQPGVARTRLLSQHRANGLQCSQERFERLYTAVTSGKA